MGYKLLSKEYRGKDSKMTCVDNEGYLYYVQYSTIRDKRKPNKYHASNPYSMYNMERWLDDNFPEYDLISEEYISNSSELYVYCNIHNEVFKTDWNHLYQRKGCKRCAIDRRSGSNSNLWTGGEVSFHCEVCNKKSSVNQYRYDRNVHHYCSKECANIGFGRFFKGEDSPMWRNDISDSERLYRRSYKEYKEFVKNVMSRDSYRCVACGKNGVLNVHHKDGYNWCVNRRLDIDNGVTLCKEHHNEFHMKYGRGGNTELQFKEWIREFG